MKNSFFVIVFFYAFVTFGQDRLQIGISGSNNLVRAVNLKEKGLILLDKAPNGYLKIKKFDKNLGLVWDIDTDLPAKVNFVDEFVADNFLYLLLETRNGDALQILKISTQFAASQKYLIKSVPNFEVTHFAVNNDSYCIAGTVKNDPVLIFYEASSPTPRFISSNLKGEKSLQTVDISDNEVNVTILNKNKKKTDLIYRSYTLNGRGIVNKIINPKAEFEFLSTKFFESEGKRLIIGNYGIRGNNRNEFASSQGIFVCNLAETEKTKFYPFDKLNNFFDFLNNRQKERLNKQVAKKREKGGEYRFDYRLSINEVLPQSQNLLISAEVFVPEFRTNNMGMGGWYGNPMFFQSGFWGRQYLNSIYWANNPALWGYRTRNSQTFDGFRYIQGMVISIDQNGNLIWDKSFQYKNLKYYDLKPHLKISDNVGNTLVSFAKENKLNVNEFRPDGSSFRNAEIDKSMDEKWSKQKKSEFENFEHWYDNYFINWGIIKNNDTNTNFKMSCFIQKIAY
jgi:hypothetical protein